MPQHVGMDSERHFGGRPEPRHHAAKGNRRHRRAALAHEDISAGFWFALETAQGAKFDAGQWMDGRHPILKAMDVQAAASRSRQCLSSRCWVNKKCVRARLHCILRATGWTRYGARATILFT